VTEVTSTRPGSEAPELSSGQGYYVYGIIRASDGVPDGLVGLDGALVNTVRHGRIAAAVGVIALDRPPGRRADLMAHSEVLDALASAAPVVPVQFGTAVDDRDGLVDVVLAPEEEQLAELLDSLEGRVQLNLKASYREDVVLGEVVTSDPEIAALREAVSGQPEDKAYGERVRLGQLVSRAMEHKRAQDTEVLLDAVLPYVEAHAMRDAGGLDHVFDVALLVDEARLGELDDHLEGLAEAVHERIRLRLVGPVAPYDFVGGHGWA